MIVDVGVKPPFPKEYLGDGAYVSFDGYHYVLTTENGISIQNTVCLDPGCVTSFLRYMSRVRGATS
jgi:hypothetical protein